MMINKVYDLLLAKYGRQGWWPITPEGEGKPVYGAARDSEKHKLEIALGAILTQNTSWKNVEKAMINLHDRRMVSIGSLREVDTEELAQIIRPAGYFNQKAKKIKGYIRFLDSGKKMTREELLGVWGIGKETADSILLYAFDEPEFVVDAYTRRMFSHYGLIDGKEEYDDIKEKFEKELGKDLDIYKEYHALIVEHGKRHFSKRPYGKDDPLKTSL